MADERLRELERKARAGDPEAQVQLLGERVRTGDLRQEKLEAAASLGHPLALRAVDAPPSPLAAEPFFARLLEWGWEAIVRTALGLVLDPQNLRPLAQYQSTLYREALAATLEALQDPNEATRAEARSLTAADVPFTYWRWYQSQEGLRTLGATRCAAAADAPAALRELRELAFALMDPQQVDPPRNGWGPYADDDEAWVYLGLDQTPSLLSELRRGAASWALGEPLPLTSSQVGPELDALKRKPKS